MAAAAPAAVATGTPDLPYLTSFFCWTPLSFLHRAGSFLAELVEGLNRFLERLFIGFQILHVSLDGSVHFGLGLAEFCYGFSQHPCNLRQPVGAEDDEHEEQDEYELNTADTEQSGLLFEKRTAYSAVVSAAFFTTRFTVLGASAAGAGAGAGSV